MYNGEGRVSGWCRVGGMNGFGCRIVYKECFMVELKSYFLIVI